MSLGREAKDSLIAVYYAQIFEIHSVQDSTFFNEFEILRKDPKKLKNIYEKVLEEIEKLGIENNAANIFRHT